MTKEKFASQLAKELKAKGIKMNRDTAEHFIAALSKSMREGLACDRTLIVSNFGSFEAILYGAKIIQSPRKDGKKFFMPPTDVVKWHPSGKIRERAVSEPVSEEEHRSLIGRSDETMTAAAIIADLPTETVSAEAPIQSAAQYEVKVRVADRTIHLTDECSPLSKFVKAILGQMKVVGADKLEIVPQRLKTALVYSTAGIIKNSRTLTRDSHAVVVKKIKSLAGPENEFSLTDCDRIKLAKQLTPFGEQLIIQRVY